MRLPVIVCSLAPRKCGQPSKTPPRLDTSLSNSLTFGPTRDVSHLGNGEVRHQFGVKLKAQDICNLVYVMWNFDPQKIAVSVKLNPGQRTHEDCLDRGYINNMKPTVSVAPPFVRTGLSHALEVDLKGNALTVTAVGSVVWQGALVPVVLSLSGPVGLRSDNVQVAFDFIVGR